MYVRVLSDDGPLKITTYHVTWLSSRNKAFTFLLNVSLQFNQDDIDPKGKNVYLNFHTL